MKKSTRRTITLSIVAVAALMLISTRMFASTSASVDVVPVTVQYGDTAWAICENLGHKGDIRTCAAGHGYLQAGATVQFKVTR